MSSLPRPSPPDRDMLGRADHCAGFPVRKAKTFKMLRVVPDNQEIPLRNHVGQRRQELFRMYGFSPFSIKAERREAGSYVNLINGMACHDRQLEPRVPITFRWAVNLWWEEFALWKGRSGPQAPDGSWTGLRCRLPRGGRDLRMLVHVPAVLPARVQTLGQAGRMDGREPSP